MQRLTARDENIYSPEKPAAKISTRTMVVIVAVASAVVLAFVSALSFQAIFASESGGGSKTVESGDKIIFNVVVAGVVEDFKASEYRQNLATLLSVNTNDIELLVSSASVRVQAVILSSEPNVLIGVVVFPLASSSRSLEGQE